MIRDIDTPFIDDEDFDRVINDWLWGFEFERVKVTVSRNSLFLFWHECIEPEQNKNSCGYMLNKGSSDLLQIGGDLFQTAGSEVPWIWKSEPGV